jgi:hypothetical protein
MESFAKQQRNNDESPVYFQYIKKTTEWKNVSFKQSKFKTEQKQQFSNLIIS